MVEIVEVVRPKLRTDGMFLVGRDIVGDKLMEINVFSPGGLHTCEKLYETNFAETVIGRARVQGRSRDPLLDWPQQRHRRHPVRPARRPHQVWNAALHQPCIGAKTPSTRRRTA
jgi:hypothetical protein